MEEGGKGRRSGQRGATLRETQAEGLGAVGCQPQLLSSVGCSSSLQPGRELRPETLGRPTWLGREERRNDLPRVARARAEHSALQLRFPSINLKPKQVPGRPLLVWFHLRALVSLPAALPHSQDLWPGTPPPSLQPCPTPGTSGWELCCPPCGLAPLPGPPAGDSATPSPTFRTSISLLGSVCLAC